MHEDFEVSDLGDQASFISQPPSLQSSLSSVSHSAALSPDVISTAPRLRRQQPSDNLQLMRRSPIQKGSIESLEHEDAPEELSAVFSTSNVDDLEAQRARVEEAYQAITCMDIFHLCTESLRLPFKLPKADKSSWISQLSFEQCQQALETLTGYKDELEKKNLNNAAAKGLQLLKATLEHQTTPKAFFGERFNEFMDLLKNMRSLLGFSEQVQPAKFLNTLIKQSAGNGKGKFKSLVNNRDALSTLGQILKMIVKLNPEAKAQLDV